MKKEIIKSLLINAGYDTEIISVITLEMHARLLNKIIREAGGKFWFNTDGILWNVLMCIDYPSSKRIGMSQPKNISFGQFYLSSNDRYDIDKLANTILELQEEYEQIIEQLPNKKDIEEIERGTIVKTCDNRYGIVRGVDWHAMEFLKRPDYQIQFPDGTGIFRRDEFEIINPKNVEPASKSIS